MRQFSKFWTFFLFVFGPVLLFSAEVTIYSAPEGESLSEDYQVWVNDQQLDVYTARVQDPPWDKTGLNHGGAYSFVNFDIGGPVTIRIVSLNRSVKETIVRPLSYGVTPEIINEKELRLSIEKPIKLSIELDGRNSPLLIFINPPEEDVPDKNDPNVIYYGPGVYKPRLIALKDKQTLYIAGGAVVKGSVIVAGDSVTICGRGILDGSDWEWTKGPAWNMIAIFGDNVVVKDIIIRGAPHWTLVPQHCKNILVENVKICNGRVQNDDGINPVNVQDMTIDNCFIRSDDDCIALKGMEYKDRKNNNVERITIKNTILWCDRARVTLLGHESRAEYMRDIIYENIDIIHFYMVPFLLEPGEDMLMKNVMFKNIRLNGEGQDQLIRLRPVSNQYMHKQVPGFIENIHFENITVNGASGKYKVQVFGVDEEHIIKDVEFENVLINGVKLGASSDNVEKDNFTDQIQIN